MRGSSMPQISSGYSEGFAISVGSGSIRHPSIPFAERAAHKMRQAGPVFNAAKQQSVSVGQRHGPGVEDTVDRIGPVFPAEDRIAGIAREQRMVGTWSRIAGCSRALGSGDASRGNELDSKRDTHFLLQFVLRWYFGCLHFEQGHQERKR